jgi:cytochrome c biogenesis protein
MAVTRNKTGEGEIPRRVSGLRRIYRFLSSVRFTMLVLPLIAAACIAGTFVQQQASPQEYLARYSESTYGSLRILGLTDVFHAPWFLLLIGLFVLNLVLCTTGRLSLFVKSLGKTRIPREEALALMSPGFFAPGVRIDDVARLFKGYRESGGDDGDNGEPTLAAPAGTAPVPAGPGRGLALEKGRLSKYGVYVIHASILVILIGSVIGLMFGYHGSITLNKGEVKDAIVKKGSAGRPVPLGFAIGCDNFELIKYPSGEPKDYRSTVRILDGGKPVREAVVRVNHPLTYRGTNIYQASYGVDRALLFDIGGKEVRLSQGDVYETGTLALMVMRFEESVHDFGPGVQIAYLDGNEPKAFWFLRDVPGMRQKEIMGVNVRLKEIREEYYTGLEISRDPGVWVVWTGFAMILFGLYINFFVHHRRVYLRQTAEGVRVAGVSSRNKEAFDREFDRWRERTNGLK